MYDRNTKWPRRKKKFREAFLSPKIFLKLEFNLRSTKTGHIFPKSGHFFRKIRTPFLKCLITCLTSFCALRSSRVFLPYLPACLWFLRAFLFLRALRALRAFNFLRALRALIFTCLTCLYCFLCLTCPHLFMCLRCLHFFYVPYVPLLF